MKKLVRAFAVLSLSLGLFVSVSQAGTFWCIVGCKAAEAAGDLGCGVAGDLLIAGCVYDRAHGGTNEQFANCEADVGDFMDTCLAAYAHDEWNCESGCYANG